MEEIPLGEVGRILLLLEGFRNKTLEGLAIEFHFIRGKTISKGRNNYQDGNTTVEQQVWKRKKRWSFLLKALQQRCLTLCWPLVENRSYVL